MRSPGGDRRRLGLRPVRLVLAVVIAGALPSAMSGQETHELRRPGEQLSGWLAGQGFPADSARVIGEASIAPGFEALLVGIGLNYVPDRHLLLAVESLPTPAVWTIAEIPGRHDDVALDAAAPTDIVVRVTGGYGIEIYYQYFINRRSRTVTKERMFRDPTPEAFLLGPDTLFALQDFGEAGRFFLRMPLPSGEVSVTSFTRDEAVEDLIVRNDTLFALTTGSELWRGGRGWFGRARSAPLRLPEGVRSLFPRLPQFRIVPGGIVETRLGDSLFIPLDLPDFDHFVRARPEHAEWVGDEVEISTEIGPVTSHRGRLWFGLRFYDGEGMDGVGGIGWFDPETREARMIYPDSMADWSVSAIAGDGDWIYLGLVGYPEGDSYGGGIGRYDIATGAFRIFHVPGVAAAIAVRDDIVYSFTEKGLAVLEPDGSWEQLGLIPEGRGAARVVSRKQGDRDSGER